MLEAENLSTPFLKNLSLRFMPGKLYALIGPNGSGKSTFLKALLGIWKTTGGEVFWQGRRLHAQKQRVISRTMSYVPQSTSATFNFPVPEIVRMGRYPFQRGKEQCEDLIEWALKAVDAFHLRDRKILELSQGEQQRVYIARALVTESPIILLDEPTANLDLRHQLDIWHLLRKLSAGGRVIIVANHDLITTQRFVDDVVVMQKGACVGFGPYSEVVTPTLLQEVFGLIEYPGTFAIKEICGAY